MNIAKRTYNIRKLLIYLILFYPFVANILVNKLQIPLSDNIDEIIIIFLLLYKLLSFLKGRKIKKTELKIYLIFIIFSLCGFIPAAYGMVELKALLEGCFFQIKNFILFFLVSDVVWNERDLNKIFKILNWLYISIIVYAFLAYILPQIRMFDSIYMTSFFSHPATFATLIVPLSIYCFVNYINSGKKVDIIVFGITIICLLLAGTSKNLVSIAVVCCIYINKVKKSRKYTFLIIASIGLACVLPEIISIFSDEIATNVLSDSASNRPRWLLYGTSFKIALDYFPFGSGFGTFGNSVSFTGRYSNIYSLYGIDGRYGFSRDNILFLSDTYWPSVIGETGIIGTILIIILLFMILKIGMKSVERCKYISNVTAIKGQVIVLSFIALMVESLFTATFFGLRSYFIITLLGIFVSIVNSLNKKEGLT